MKSRLSKNLEKKSRQQFWLTVLGIIAILFLLVKFGIPALINFSLFLSSGKGSSNTDTQKGNTFIATPVLDTIVTATNSASIDISGSAQPKLSIELYVNDSKSDEVNTKNDGTFLFRDVSLHQGQNSIQVKAKQDSNESNFSDTQIVTYKNNAPSLTIDSPSDGQAFSKDQSSVTISGKSDPDAKVTVNDFWAISDDKGNYSYTLHLQNGDNQIKVVATDAAGNKTEKSIKLTYSQ